MRALSISSLLASVSLIALACDSGPYDVRLLFPDDRARARAEQIRITVIDPGADADCQALLELTAAPGDAGYAVEDEIAFVYPPAGDVDRLQEVGTGRRLFYAEAEDGTGEVLLNACAAVTAGLDGPGRVTLELAWLPGHECRPSRGGTEWCDGLDNDCDGTIDGPDCRPCQSDVDCQALNECIDGSCDGGTCRTERLADDAPCDDGDACTVDDSCQDGVCSGQGKDCDDGLACTVDTCRAETGQCQNALQSGHCLIADTCYADGASPPDNTCLSCDATADPNGWQQAPAGTSCDDGLWCTGTDTCDAAGDCIHTELPCTETCMGACDEQTQSCGPDEAGTACDDGFSCTGDDACDGQGGCRGSPIPGYCGAEQECLPDCAGDEIGCVDRPDYVDLDCPQWQTYDGPAVCSVALPGGQGTEACLHCEVELLPSVLSDTPFYDGGCTTGDWAFTAAPVCRNAGGYCPLELGGQAAPCCTQTSCNPGDRGIELQNGACGNVDSSGWRLARLFDLSSFARVRTCYEVLQRPEPYGGMLQVMTDDGDQAVGNAVACDEPGMWSGEQHTRPCVELPGLVTDRETTRITLWAQVDADFDPTNLLGLGGVWVYAYPPECDSEVIAVETDFAACGQDVASHAGWVFDPPASCADGQQECSRDGGLLLGSVGGLDEPELDASLVLDLRGLVEPGRLCWNHYRSVNFNGSYQISFFSNTGGAWWVPVYDSQFQQFFPADECREICIDLSGQMLSVMGRTGFEIGISGEATSGYLLLTDLRIYGSEACAADGVLAAGGVQPDGQEGHQVEVTDGQQQPRRGRLTCRWGSGEISASREIEFIAPE